MHEYKEKFDALIRVKKEPNTHEKYLFERAQKYVAKLTWIPGVEMIAVVNSLSMYATHDDSDIDLFIVTKPGMIWFVRFLVTLTLWKEGVWRKGEDIRENFCLSFFITTEAMNLEKIALENDIYLYYWIYYMKPVYGLDSTCEEFLQTNSWIHIPNEQRIQNTKYKIQNTNNHSTLIITFCRIVMNPCIRLILKWKTLKKYEELGSPWGVIINDSMLKFHDQDARTRISNTILEKNFDK